MIRWLTQRFAALPDPRRQEYCRYSGEHMWWAVLYIFLTRAGSRNAFDGNRNSGCAAANMGALCGQKPDDPRFGGQPMITCSDNLARHLTRVDASFAAPLIADLCAELLKRRMLEDARLFGRYYIVAFDGTVQERCRKNFEEGGKSAGVGAKRYRYVLQCGLLGPGMIFLPLMHEHVDMHDPKTEKEDCELVAFFRLVRRLKERFPRLLFCLIGDALFCTARVAELCEAYKWKYVLTLKEGSQPNLWNEVLELLPLSTGNVARRHTGQDGREGRRDFRWVDHLALGTSACSAVLVGEITRTEAILYAYVTNLCITPTRVCEIISTTGRERHRIEDYFNSAKNNGIGLEHVFCADANASKNFFSLMQLAAILWTIICHGCLRRTFAWAARATHIALARALAEGLRSYPLPDVLPIPGQLRFVG
jgi:hypothetical protein